MVIYGNEVMVIGTNRGGGLWATALDKVDKSISKPDVSWHALSREPWSLHFHAAIAAMVTVAKAVTFNTMIHATTADVWQLSFSFLQNMRCARLACTVKSSAARAPVREPPPRKVTIVHARGKVTIVQYKTIIQYGM